MGLSERIGELYSGIEEKFYSAMDFVADRGVPVYALIDPLEEKGIPAFPVAIAALIALLAVIYGVFFIGPQQATMALSIEDNAGATLSGVSISAKEDRSGKTIDLGSTSFRDGQVVKLPLGIGSKIVLEASKQGYETARRTVYFERQEVNASLVLKKTTKQIAAGLRLVDEKTGDAVEGAVVSARFSETSSVECTESEKGGYDCVGVPEGEKTSLTIKHPNYEQRQLDAAFRAGSPTEVELVAKPDALRGTTNLLVRTFDSETKERSGNFTLRVYDAKDNELISETTETDGDGEQIVKISKGTSVRVVVEKKDYLTYDSSIVEENETLLSDEVKKEVYLRPGTNALTVGVIDATGRPLQSIAVTLFNSNGEVIKSKETNLAGETVFENLSAQEAYYASAWQESFLPATQKVVLSQNNRATLVMQRGTATNSGSLTIFTADEKSKPIPGATLNFLLEDANKVAPLGVPGQKSDVTGKFTFLAPLNSSLMVKASKGNLVGEARVKVLETFRNEAFITMREPFSIVSLRVLDKEGNEVEKGFVTVSAGKDILAEGEYAPGFTFNPKGSKYVNVSFSDEEGNAFEEEVFVQDKNEITVSPTGKKGSGAAPEVEFLGLFNVDGSKAEAMAKGIDYFIKFRAVYSPGTAKNGLHVRLGDDTVNFVDSQDAGIIGFSATGAGAFYGRSYSPRPEPGFEALDFENSGSEGKHNKWLELYFQSAGEKIVKVRVKAKETSATPDIEAHYRAWSTIGNSIYRTPEDRELGLEQFTANRTSLYADTLSERVRIIEASAQCKNDLCASYRFAGSDGSEFAPDKFKAVLGEVYALDVSLSPTASRSVTVKASTAKQNPKIGFQGFGIDQFSNFPDVNSQDTSIQVDNVSASSSESTSVRLFFKALKPENSSITLQLVSGETVINEQFYFDVFKERAITLRTTPENVVFGEDFAINLQTEDRASIENAQVRLLGESGQNLLTITGTGSANKGANGRYLVKNNFSAGTVKYEARAEGFRGLDGTIEITKSGVLKFAEEKAFLVIQKSVKSAEKFLELANNSRQGVQNIAFEVRPVTPLPAGMEVKVTPVSNIPPNTNQRVIVSAEYNGEKETAHGEARVIARGKTEAGFTVTAETKVVVDYNPKLSQECVEFSKDRVVVYVASGMEDRSFYDSRFVNYRAQAQRTGIEDLPETSRSSAFGVYPNTPSKYYRYYDYTTASNETFTAKLASKPECQVQLELKAEAIAQGRKDQGLTIEASPIRLVPQQGRSDVKRTDSQEVTITVANNMIRNYPSRERFAFELLFKGEGIEKSIPVEVIIWNPKYALQVTRNIELFLGPNDQGVYSSQVPLFVRNVGEADIENVDFRVSSATSRGNIEVQITPPYAVQFLRKGDTIFPPKTIVAQVLRNEKTTLQEVKELDITGVINGQTFSFGPVFITAHVSAAQCVIASPSTVSFFSTKSTEGALTQEITVRNTCAEEVRVVELSRPNIGRNSLSLAPQGGIIPPFGEARFNLVLEKREDYQGSVVPLYIRSFLVRSGSPIDSNPIIVDLKLGKVVGKGEAASEAVTLPVCEGGTKTVRFPIVTGLQKPICDNSYCDAQQLSSYLADKVNEAIRDAEKQIQNRSAEIQKTDCSQVDLARGFCSFDGLGVKTPQFIVYMSHDNISPALMQRAIEQQQGSIRSYRVDFIQGERGGEYLGGLGKQIYMNSNFQGCGRYIVKLNGDVRVEGSRIVPELMNIVIDITPEEANSPARQLTEQCLSRVQNINNFLPRDEGLAPNQKLDSWLGVVQARDRSLDEVATDVAKTMFGSDKRAITGAQGSNVLNLDLGKEQGYLVRIEMDKVETQGPVSIRAYVREALGAEEKLQKDIAREAAQAIKNLRDNVIEGCIGEDESYLLLKSTKDIGRITLEVKDSVPVLFEAPACLYLNVTSDIKESVALSARKSSFFDGITSDSPFFKPALVQGQQETGERISEVKTEKFDEQKKRFTGAARVCVVGNSQLQQAQGKTIIVSAKRAEGQAKKPEEREVPLQVCGIHPLKFIEKTKDAKFEPNKQGEHYYATFVWKGEPERILLSDFTRLSEANERVANADAIIDNKRQILKEDPPEVVKAKTRAAHAYVGTCVATTAVTSALRPLVGWGAFAFNALFDCGVPYMALLGKDLPVLSTINKFVEEGFGWLFSFAKGIVRALEVPIKGMLALAGVKNVDFSLLESPPDNTVNTVLDAYVPSSLIADSILAKRQLADVTKYEDSPTRIKALSKVRVVAEGVADDIIEKLHKEGFNSATTPEVQSFMDDFKTKFMHEVDEEIFKHGAGQAPVRGRVLSDEELKTIINKAADKVGRDTTVLQNFARARTGINTLTPNSFIEKEAIDKEILGEVDKITEKITTRDLVPEDRVLDADVATAKVRVETDTTERLKTAVLREYASVMDIDETTANAAFRGELGGISVEVDRETGATAREIASQETSAVKDVVKKEVIPELETTLSQKLSSKTGITGTEVDKITQEIKSSMGRKLSERATSLTVDPQSLGQPTLKDIRAQTIQILAADKGVPVKDVELLFGARLDSELGSAGTDVIRVWLKAVDFINRNSGITDFTRASNMLDSRLYDGAEKQIQKILGEKLGLRKENIVDDIEIEKLASKISETTKGKITIDEAKNIVNNSLTESLADVSQKTTGRLDEIVTKESGERTIKNIKETEFYNKLKVSKGTQEEAVRAMKERLAKITKEAIEDPTAHPDLQKAVQKAYIKKGAPKVIESLKGKVDLKDAVPGFFSGKGQLLFWKNLVKEGAFGALANVAGLKAYDTFLNYQLKKINHTPDSKTREKEIADAGIGFVQQVFAAEPGAGDYILKYRTYKVTVTSLPDGRKSIKLALAREGIPSGTKKELILNDCEKPGFDQEVGAVLPSLFPVVEPETKMPRAFRKSGELKALHVKIVRNYLAAQPTGERYGSLITAATRDLAPNFKAQTGLELEPLVVSIGIVKSQLGNDPKIKSDYMFGCSLGVTAKKDVYNNARCAAEKLVAYIPKCKDAPTNKATCFLKEYNEDQRTPKNQLSNADLMTISDEEFQDIYNTWSGQDYKWRAP